MHHPLSFSVIIPLYNKEAYIARAIQSVVAQDWQDYEVLVIDDGSTDNGPEVLGPWLPDPRIRLITQANSGAGAARNRGLAEMRNDVAAFLDADDEWLPSHLRDLAELASTYPQSGELATAYCAAYPGGLAFNHSIDRHSPSLITDYYRLAASGHTVHISACGLHSSVLAERLRFKENAAPCEDQEFYVRAALHSSFAYHPRISALYHHDVGGSVMANARWLATLPLTAETLSGMLRDDVVPAGMRESASAYLAWLIEQHGLAGLALGEKAGARSLLRQAQLEPISDRCKQRLNWLEHIVQMTPLSLLKLSVRFRRSRWYLVIAKLLSKRIVYMPPSATVRATTRRQAAPRSGPVMGS